MINGMRMVFVREEMVWGPRNEKEEMKGWGV